MQLNQYGEPKAEDIILRALQSRSHTFIELLDLVDTSENYLKSVLTRLKKEKKIDRYYKNYYLKEPDPLLTEEEINSSKLTRALAQDIRTQKLIRDRVPLQSIIPYVAIYCILKEITLPKGMKLDYTDELIAELDSELGSVLNGLL